MSMNIEIPPMGFKPDPNVEASPARTLIPPGWYETYISASEIKRNNKDTGYNCSLTFTITGPTSENRKIFKNLAYVNPSAQAQEIAEKELHLICAAVNLTGNLDHPTQLENVPMRIRIGAKKDNRGEMETAIYEYKKFSDVPGPAAAAPVPPPVAVPAATTDSPPWKEDDIPF